MSQERHASYSAGSIHETQPADLDSTAERAAPAGESGSEGISGAPPSNTAPYNCNHPYQPLRWGIDSLYLSYPGQLSSYFDGKRPANPS